MNMNDPTKRRLNAQDPSSTLLIVTSCGNLWPSLLYKINRMLMFIITNRVTLLSFGLAPAEIRTSDTVSPSRPVMNKSWSVRLSAEPTDQTTVQGRRRQVLSPARARNLISNDKMKSLDTMTDSVQTLHVLLVVEQVLRGLLRSVFYCRLFINTHILSATAAVTFSAVVHIRALSPFWLCEWDNLSMK